MHLCAAKAYIHNCGLNGEWVGNDAPLHRLIKLARTYDLAPGSTKITGQAAKALRATISCSC